MRYRVEARTYASGNLRKFWWMVTLGLIVILMLLSLNGLSPFFNPEPNIQLSEKEQAYHQRITQLEAENRLIPLLNKKVKDLQYKKETIVLLHRQIASLKRENARIPDLKNKISELESFGRNNRYRSGNIPVPIYVNGNVGNRENNEPPIVKVDLADLDSEVLSEINSDIKERLLMNDDMNVVADKLYQFQ